ncbi:D-serine ammonia-lyase [Lactiplantibacillus garii]|uniref:Probable D-serine dehydratase n=1 Tax=Lactiplantibacillus garii TaxID=2306423 RepID=A0A3R8J6M0_9LACO|nr:D-serine ammonia-lyase [Lactiplantibacillus garii]RRK10102.1 D-serine ammonia-lyase [Lactiplantibacillus garii]
MDKQKLIQEHPQIKDLMAKKPIVWRNPDYGERAPLPLSRAQIFDAVARWERFAPYLERVFPETVATHGVIESPLIRIDRMRAAWEMLNHQSLHGQLYLKADSELPVSGSIKSRGGIYEVLKFAERVAMQRSDLTYLDDYGVLANSDYHRLFAQYGVIVASTGNLALSVGIAAASFGFKTTVYMSHDARQWKKDRLRANGVTVKEFDTDFSSVIPLARQAAAADPHCHFVDDEGSTDLFLGYAVAAVRLQHQFKKQGIKVDAKHPVVVYLPAGVGGSPSGVAFGLKMIMGANVHPVFCEPTHVPSVTLGMMTKLNEKISVQDIGLDGLTAADGLAVSRPSRIAGKIMRTLLLGSVTFNDDDLFEYVSELIDTQKITVEPSAAAGFTAIKPLTTAVPELGGANVTHVVWATGGDMMPVSERERDYQRGTTLLTHERFN